MNGFTIESNYEGEQWGSSTRLNCDACRWHVIWDVTIQLNDLIRTAEVHAVSCTVRRSLEERALATSSGKDTQILSVLDNASARHAEQCVGLLSESDKYGHDARD